MSKVWNLRFADDIDLIDKSPAGIQEMITKSVRTAAVRNENKH